MFRKGTPCFAEEAHVWISKILKKDVMGAVFDKPADIELIIPPIFRLILKKSDLVKSFAPKKDFLREVP